MCEVSPAPLRNETLGRRRRPQKSKTMFFDLSIPYIETPKTTQAPAKILTLTRLKTLARSMDLGYTSVAYDRTIKSMLSDADHRRRIPLFSLQSLLEVAPTIPNSVNFHRDCNGVSRAAPLRQYTRVTVEVNRGSVGTAFNGKGMSLLRSCYDLVAVKTLDQDAFDKACQGLDVDIITLDFPLKFRLKLPMVETAIKRGVCFEIKYANLIADVNLKRQMLPDARLLVNWTKGKNLIISSSAASMNDIRGPYDVANLTSFLLGLSKERAKAAISGNCRTLIAYALRKKDYKEAIGIEKISSDEQLNSESDWFGDWKEWDPLSSGESDLPPLDDISKIFSAVNKPPQNPPAIDFLSCGNGFSLKDHISSTGKDLLVPGEKETLISCSKESTSDAATMLSSSTYDVLPSGIQISSSEVTVSPRDLPMMSADKDKAALAIAVFNTEILESSTQNNVTSDAVGSLSSDVPLNYCTSTCKDSLVTRALVMTSSPAVDEISIECMEDVKDSHLPDMLGDSDETALDLAVSNNEILESSIQDNVAFDAAGTLLSDMPLKNCSFTGNDRLASQDPNLTGASTFGKVSTACMDDFKNSDGTDVTTVANESPRPVTKSADISSIADHPLSSNGCRAFSIRALEKVIQEEKIKGKTVERERKDEVLCDEAPQQMDSDSVEPSPCKQGEGACLLLDTLPFEDVFCKSLVQEKEEIFVNSDSCMKEVLVKLEDHNHQGSAGSVGCAPYRLQSGKRKQKRRSYPAFPLTFKGLLKPMLFKKKSCQSRRFSRHWGEEKMSVKEIRQWLKAMVTRSTPEQLNPGNGQIKFLSNADPCCEYYRVGYGQKCAVAVNSPAAFHDPWSQKPSSWKLHQDEKLRRY